MASSNVLAQFSVDGKEYTLSQTDFTMSRMRHAKGWFGPEYGEYLTVLQKFMRGDADAVALAVWIAMKKEGEHPPEPNRMDYAIGDIIMPQSEDEVLEEAIETVKEAVVEDDAAPPTSTKNSKSGSKQT